MVEQIRRSVTVHPTGWDDRNLDVWIEVDTFDFDGTLDWVMRLLEDQAFIDNVLVNTVQGLFTMEVPGADPSDEGGFLDRFGVKIRFSGEQVLHHHLIA